MATKDSSQNNVPKVSKLPLPVTDSPLVIDLPDGQKLVIGKMSQGSVIEVATWRGTGRPDSRTSRLMLGMSSTQSADAMEKDDGDSTDSKPVAPESGIDRYIFLAKEFAVKIWTTVKPILVKVTPVTKKLITALQRRGLPKIKLRKRSKAPTVSVVTAVENSEIDAWLNKIAEKAERSVALSASRAANPALKKKSGSNARKPVKKKKASR
ncbi:unannotated protein [freshwater metagenome]|uniref:Unannotated protein n=1 Tax=freshwater metagenome TaxID=449393 RepID=A0A6J6ELE1_9ZZZZ|nr:hypothetical protein [Actinomycetota bacterium]